MKDPAELFWLDAPPAASWDSARRLLLDLGALDARGKVTSVGKAMVRLPLHPRLARLLLRAGEIGCLRLGADLAALLSERDIMRRVPTRAEAQPEDVFLIDGNRLHDEQALLKLETALYEQLRV